MSIVSLKLKELRKRRAEEHKKRRSFLPSLVITVVLWLFFATVIFLMDPAAKGALPLFFLLLFFTNLFTFSLIFGNTRRGLLASIAFVSFTFLLYLGIGTIINLGLIIGVVILFEYAYTSLIN